MQAFLLLEDGTRFYGTPFGAHNGVAGAVVFNTVMSGYLNGLKNPLYSGSILTLTYPLIMNGGIDFNPATDKVSVKGLIIKELCEVSDNYPPGCTLEDFMKKHHITGLKNVDTRALTIKIRNGATRGMICFGEPDEKQLKEFQMQKAADSASRDGGTKNAEK